MVYNKYKVKEIQINDHFVIQEPAWDVLLKLKFC